MSSTKRSKLATRSQQTKYSCTRPTPAPIQANPHTPASQPMPPHRTQINRPVQLNNRRPPDRRAEGEVSPNRSHVSFWVCACGTVCAMWRQVEGWRIGLAKCEACGWEWSAWEKPARCARCKSRRWDGGALTLPELPTVHPAIPAKVGRPTENERNTPPRKPQDAPLEPRLTLSTPQIQAGKGKRRTMLPETLAALYCRHRLYKRLCKVCNTAQPPTATSG